MKDLRLAYLCVLATLAGFALGGCASTPPAARTGFISDYSNLTTESAAKMKFVSPRLADYGSFLIDPVEVRVHGDALSPEDRAEAARYFRGAFVKVVEGQGLGVVDRPGVGVARVRLALTDVAKSTWWQKIHPASRMTGAGTGGAAMEGEVIDSVTGEQVAAIVQAGQGNQFDFSAFSTLADVKNAIDAWAEQAGARLKELRSTK